MLYIGDVGLHGFEDLNVVTGPGLNFGWPIYEGLESHATFRNSTVVNQDAPNPLFGTGGCTQQQLLPFAIFSFRTRSIRLAEPMRHRTADPVERHAVCAYPAAIDWRHENGPARTEFAHERHCRGHYWRSRLSGVGPQFGGTSSIGGVWYQGDDFPAIIRTRIFTPITKSSGFATLCSTRQ